MLFSSRTQHQLSLWLLTFSVFAFALITLSVAFLCFQFPFELEVRESTVWLHILAREAGIDIYDGSKVAFINMVYGPIEAIAKGAIHFLLPFLESFQVIRFFVPLLPLSFVFAAWGWRPKLMDAILVACPFYLLLTVTDPMATVIGRPDPTAFFFINLLLYFTAPRIVESWRVRKKSWLIIVGALGAVVFHTSWRFFPIAAFYISGSLVSYTLPERDSFDKKGLLKALTWLAGVFVAISFALVLYEFGFNFGEYYRRFFGIFTDESGWGAFPAERFQLVPNQLLNAGQIFIAGATVATVLTLWVNREKKRELAFWAIAVGLIWLLHAYSYYKNGVGGGVRYYYPVLILIWTMGMHLFTAVEVRLPQWRVIFCLLAWVGLPWEQIGDLTDRLWSDSPRANHLLQGLRRLPRDQVWSDCYHLFKTGYGGDVIDTPDIASRVAKTGYFGPAFSKTVKEHFESLATRHPRYILTGFIDPAETLKLAESKGYQKLFDAPDHNLGNGFRFPATLFKRKEN